MGENPTLLFPFADQRLEPSRNAQREGRGRTLPQDGRLSEAELAYCVATITNNTTASGVELRGLRLENVYLRPAGEISEIYIPPEACKNTHRPRKIALNEVAKWAVSKVYQRAIKLGSTKPEHYLFPIRVKRNE